jgi:hypothetical protein
LFIESRTLLQSQTWKSRREVLLYLGGATKEASGKSSLAWGSELYKTVLNLEELICLLSPEFVRVAVAAAEARYLVPTRPAPSVPQFETVSLSLSCNREHDRRRKLTRWRDRVEASVGRKIDRLQSLKRRNTVASGSSFEKTKHLSDT